MFKTIRKNSIKIIDALLSKATVIGFFDDKNKNQAFSVSASAALYFLKDPENYDDLSVSVSYYGSGTARGEDKQKPIAMKISAWGKLILCVFKDTDADEFSYRRLQQSIPWGEKKREANKAEENRQMIEARELVGDISRARKSIADGGLYCEKMSIDEICDLYESLDLFNAKKFSCDLARIAVQSEIRECEEFLEGAILKVALESAEKQKEGKKMKKETEITKEQLSFAGCYAITEEEFEREIENFVCDEVNDFFEGSYREYEFFDAFDGRHLDFNNQVNGENLNISFYTGDDSNGELPETGATNFHILSKREPDINEEYYIDFCEDEYSEDEVKRIKALGFRSKLNIDTYDFRCTLLGV